MCFNFPQYIPKCPYLAILLINNIASNVVRNIASNIVSNIADSAIPSILLNIAEPGPTFPPERRNS